MYDSQQKWDILGAQPIFELRRFAELLGWRGLRLVHVTLDDGRLVIFYQTTDEKLHLQINPHPLGQATHYRATVIATRYGFPLDAVGFHDFSLTGRDDDLQLTAERLKAILSRRNFRNKEWRKRLKLANC
jgi:hypothetical protein